MKKQNHSEVCPSAILEKVFNILYTVEVRDIYGRINCLVVSIEEDIPMKGNRKMLNRIDQDLFVGVMDRNLSHEERAHFRNFACTQY